MTLEKQFIHALRAEIRASELVSEPLPALPLPTNIEVERDVVGALLSKEVKVQDFQELLPEHFYLPFYAWFFTKLHAASQKQGFSLSDGLLCAAGETEGISSKQTYCEIRSLKARPFLFREIVQKKASYLIELHKTRQLIIQLGRVDVALRTGSRSLVEAKNFLRNVVA